MPIPYWDPAPIHTGSVYLQWPWILWGSAGLLHHALFLRDASLSGRNPRTASKIHFLALASALGGGLFYAKTTATGASITVAASFGLAAAFLWARLQNLHGRQLGGLVQSAASALPVPAALMRLGCVAEHAHQGAFSDHWLAVDYPGGARWDLALLEIPFFLLWAILVRTAWVRAPWQAPALLLTYGLCRLATGSLQSEFAPTQLPYAGLFFCGTGLLLAYGFWRMKESLPS